LAITSRRCFCLRRFSIQVRTQPAPRAERFFEPSVALENMRPSETCVDSTVESAINVRRTMIDPVRLRYSESSDPSQLPSEPPA
jgi:hypothetical protein